MPHLKFSQLWEIFINKHKMVKSLKILDNVLSIDTEKYCNYEGKKKDICETLMQPSFGHKFWDVQAFIMGSIVQMKLTF